MTRDPHAEYAARLDERRAELRLLEQQDRRLSLARGIVAAIAIVTAVTLEFRASAIVVLVVAALLFLALVVVHEKVARQVARGKRRVAFYETAMARAGGEWIGRGEPGLRFVDPGNPYSGDLDLFGMASLYTGLCTARTHAGQDRLALWLREGAPLGDLWERQVAVAEVGPRLDLREDMAVLGAEARRAVDSTALVAWAAAAPVGIPQGLRVAAFAATAAVLASVTGYAFDLWGPYPFYLTTAAVALCRFLGRRFSDRVLEGIGRPGQDLRTLTEIFDRLGTERFEAPRLAQLHAALSASGQPPAKPIAQLRRWLEFHESKGNVFFALLAFFLVWDVQLAAAVEGWRRRFGGATLRWLHTLGELEALVSLGTYAFENPDDPFPELQEAGPLFHAKGIGHPLLPTTRAVRNDVLLDAERQMLVVTGSNMSGKSTLLRTVGINTVLALAGAPVRAISLRISPLVVGASIRVQDSLQDGESRFYAEIKRIRQILDLAQGEVPALFLLDEIFDGTNSAERRVGAEAVVRSLLERRALGLVTSHDLALAEIATSLAPRATKVHFEDHLEGGRMAFVYRIKPGPVQKGNALGLMRAVGLEV
jgi:hypothetical protein